MPESSRITFRLTPTLEACMSDAVGHGHHVSDIIREALEAYFGLRLTQRPTNGAAVSDSAPHVSNALSDVSAALADVVSDVLDIRTRMAALEARLDELVCGVGQSQTARPTPEPVPATPEPQEPLVASESLPDHITTIAEVAAQYDKMTLAELAQLLFDRGIYRTRDNKTGEEKPVNRGTLKKWLDKARDAGML